MTPGRPAGQGIWFSTHPAQQGKDVRWWPWWTEKTRTQLCIRNDKKRRAKEDTGDECLRTKPRLSTNIWLRSSFPAVPNHPLSRCCLCRHSRCQVGGRHLLCIWLLLVLIWSLPWVIPNYLYRFLAIGYAFMGQVFKDSLLCPAKAAVTWQELLSLDFMSCSSLDTFSRLLACDNTWCSFLFFFSNRWLYDSIVRNIRNTSNFSEICFLNSRISSDNCSFYPNFSPKAES